MLATLCNLNSWPQNHWRFMDFIEASEADACVFRADSFCINLMTSEMTLNRTFKMRPSTRNNGWWMSRCNQMEHISHSIEAFHTLWRGAEWFIKKEGFWKAKLPNSQWQCIDGLRDIIACTWTFPDGCPRDTISNYTWHMTCTTWHWYRWYLTKWHAPVIMSQ